MLFLIRKTNTIILIYIKFIFLLFQNIEWINFFLYLIFNFRLRKDIYILKRFWIFHPSKILLVYFILLYLVVVLYFIIKRFDNLLLIFTLWFLPKYFIVRYIELTLLCILIYLLLFFRCDSINIFIYRISLLYLIDRKLLFFWIWIFIMLNQITIYCWCIVLFWWMISWNKF